MSLDQVAYLARLFLKTHVTLFIALGLVYLTEITTQAIRFFGPFFREKKRENEVRGTALFFSFIYFVFMLLVMAYDLLVAKSAHKDFSIGVWLYIAGFLTLIFFNTYYAYHIRKVKANKK